MFLTEKLLWPFRAVALIGGVLLLWYGAVMPELFVLGAVMLLIFIVSIFLDPYSIKRSKYARVAGLKGKRKWDWRGYRR